MDPGQPDNKRPRLSTTNSWSPTGAPPHQLPPLHPPSSLPPTPHQAHHPGPPSIPPYHQQHQQHQQPPPPPYPPRSAEPHHPPHPAQQHPDERRHHEQEPPYTPMQDHYRHPASPSPAHPSYHPFSHRDPGAVKREPHEESLPHPRRPHSTGGAAPDGLPPPGPHPPPHSAPPPPVPPYSDDPRRPPHMGYDNAPPQMPPTPGGYRSYPPPPMPPQQPPPPQQYEQPAYHPQPPPENLYISSYASTQKRKATRASQACDSCRQLKAKCDETKPCKSCREKGVECKYRENVPKAMDKSQTDILEAILELKAALEKKIDTVAESFERRVQNLEGAPPHKRVKTESEGMVPMLCSPKQKSHLPPETMYRPVDEHHLDETMAMAASDDTMSPIDEPEEPDEDKYPVGQPVAPGKPAIPVNHTTTVGHVLRWPAIKEITRKAFLHNRIKPEDYPQFYEEKRGILRLYGCGEGHGGKTPNSGGNHVDSEGHRGQFDAADDNLGEPVASPSPSAEAWGQVGSLSPPNLMAGSVLTPDGSPDYSEDKVWSYVTAFENHVMALHPVITPQDLKPLVKRFLRHVSPGDRKPKPPPASAKFAVATADFSNKRKRSPTGDQVDEHVQYPQKQGRPARTIEVAIVLVVMALGKVCLYRGKLPEPAQDVTEASQTHRNGYPSSPGPGGQTSPPSYSSHSQSSGLPSPKEQNNGVSSRRPSLHGSTSKTGGRSLRNFDVIPGLEYFAVASDIIGNQRTGTTIKHVQAHILSALYYGLLGRPLESYQCLSHGDTCLHQLMRRHMDRYESIRNENSSVGLDRRDSVILVNFWSLLQLQADIFAELQVPPSGLNPFEEKMPWPNMAHVGVDLKEYHVQHYMAQLYLRKHLNELHRELYHPETSDKPVEKKLGLIKALEETVRNMMWTGEELRFDESDPPAKTFLDARLRAKYWGAQVLSYRPFVKLILDLTVKLQKRAEGATPDSDAAAALKIYAEGDATAFVGHTIEGYQDLNKTTIDNAKRGIECLFNSTEAFHNVDHERLLVTNIFGTALAQWGHLVVLCAAYRDPFLTAYVDPHRLQYDITRLLQMLNVHASERSTLKMNQRIMEYLQKDVFRNGHADPRATISFSSAASATSMTGPTIPPPPPPPPPAPNHQVPNNHQGPMGLAYAMEPNGSAQNSPHVGHRVLNHSANHTPKHPYQG